MCFTDQFSIWQYKLFPGHTSPPPQKQSKIKVWSFGLRSPELWSGLLLTCFMSQVNDNLKVSLCQSAKQNCFAMLVLLKKSLSTSNLSTGNSVCGGEVFSRVHLGILCLLQEPYLLPEHGNSATRLPTLQV